MGELEEHAICNMQRYNTYIQDNLAFVGTYSLLVRRGVRRVRRIGHLFLIEIFESSRPDCDPLVRLDLFVSYLPTHHEEDQLSLFASNPRTCRPSRDVALDNAT